MEKDSFVAYTESIDKGSYRVAIGNCSSWEKTQFIVINYTDLGTIIHYFDNSNLEKLKQQFQEFVSHITHKECKNEYKFFRGNEKSKEVIEKYKSLGVEYIHATDCKCEACLIFDGYNFRGDTIKRVIDELGEKTY